MNKKKTTPNPLILRWAVVGRRQTVLDAPFVDGRDNGPLCCLHLTASRLAWELVTIFPAMSMNFQTIPDTSDLWPSGRDSRVHRSDNWIWDLEGCHSSGPAAAKFYSEYCYSAEARTTLHLTGESRSRLREGETEGKRGNSTAALCFSLANPCGDYPPTPSFSQCHDNSVGGGCDNSAIMAILCVHMSHLGWVTRIFADLRCFC